MIAEALPSISPAPQLLSSRLKLSETDAQQIVEFGKWKGTLQSALDGACPFLATRVAKKFEKAGGGIEGLGSVENFFSTFGVSVNFSQETRGMHDTQNLLSNPIEKKELSLIKDRNDININRNNKESTDSYEIIINKSDDKPLEAEDLDQEIEIVPYSTPEIMPLEETASTDNIPEIFPEPITFFISSEDRHQDISKATSQTRRPDIVISNDPPVTEEFAQFHFPDQALKQERVRINSREQSIRGVDSQSNFVTSSKQYDEDTTYTSKERPENPFLKLASKDDSKPNIIIFTAQFRKEHKDSEYAFPVLEEDKPIPDVQYRKPSFLSDRKFNQSLSGSASKNVQRDNVQRDIYKIAKKSKQNISIKEINIRANRGENETTKIVSQNTEEDKNTQTVLDKNRSILARKKTEFGSPDKNLSNIKEVKPILTAENLIMALAVIGKPRSKIESHSNMDVFEKQDEPEGTEKDKPIGITVSEELLNDIEFFVNPHTFKLQRFIHNGASISEDSFNYKVNPSEGIEIYRFFTKSRGSINEDVNNKSQELIEESIGEEHPIVIVKTEDKITITSLKSAGKPEHTSIASSGQLESALDYMNDLMNSSLKEKSSKGNRENDRVHKAEITISEEIMEAVEMLQNTISFQEKEEENKIFPVKWEITFLTEGNDKKELTVNKSQLVKMRQLSMDNKTIKQRLEKRQYVLLLAKSREVRIEVEKLKKITELYVKRKQVRESAVLYGLYGNEQAPEEILRKNNMHKTIYSKITYNWFYCQILFYLIKLFEAANFGVEDLQDSYTQSYRAKSGAIIKFP